MSDPSTLSSTPLQEAPSVITPPFPAPAGLPSSPKPAPEPLGVPSIAAPIVGVPSANPEDATVPFAPVPPSLGTGVVLKATPPPLDNSRLEEHRKWWISRYQRRKEGARLDLSGRDFHNTDLLAGKDLRGAILRGANLRGANLTDTLVYDADLSGADLTDVTGLFPSRLGGTNLRGTTLPAALPPFDGSLKMIEAMSQNAGRLFVSVMSLCAFTYFFVGQTQDVQLFTDTGTATLPIVNVPVSVTFFYWIIPWILLGAYSYFHLQMLRLWEALSRLPAIFPDGETQDRKTSPWQLNDLVRLHMWQLLNDDFWFGPQRDTPALHLLQWFLSVFLAWALVPVTLLFPWLRYLARDYHLLTYTHCVAVSVAFLLMTIFYHITEITLRRDDYQYKKWRKPWTDGWGWCRVIATMACVAILVKISVSYHPGGQKLAGASLRRANLIGISLHKADLSSADLTGADLTGADLTGADLNDAHLTGACLKSARLESVRLKKADLTDALLSDSHLMDAQLKNANLSGADLAGADLSNADLSDARLDNANLSSAHLSYAHLVRTHLANADLMTADLTGASLYDANLSSADLSGAHLNNTNLGGSHFENARLVAAELVGARCGGTDFSGASLRLTEVTAAELSGTNLSGTDLTDTKLGEVISYSLFPSTYDARTKWPSGFHPEHNHSFIMKKGG